MPLAQSGNATLPSRFPFGWIAQPWPGWSGLGPSLWREEEINQLPACCAKTGLGCCNKRKGLARVRLFSERGVFKSS